MQDFRRLEIWRRSHALALEIRRATRGFPRTGFSDLRSQIIRAAESVPTNIVEGCGVQRSAREFARFLDIAIRSTFELEYQLQLAKDNDILSEERWSRLTREAVEVRRMICAFRRRVLSQNISR